MAITALPVYPSRLRDKNLSRAVEATVYPSGGGNPYTGYVIDGRTYKDPKGQVRIDSGSTVELRDGRSYIYDASQAYGVPTTMSSLTEYQNAINGAVANYRNSGKYNDRAVDMAYMRARNNYNAQMTQARMRAEADEKSAYMDYLKAQNPYGLLAQRNDKLGLGDSGYAETTLANLHNGYMQNVSGIRSQLSQTLASLQSQIEQAYYDGELEKARYWQQVEQDIMDYTLRAREKLLTTGIDAAKDASDNIRYEREWQQKRQDIEYDRKAEKEKWQAELEYKKGESDIDKALALMKMGLSSNQIAQTLGITPEQARYAAWRAVTPKTSAKSSSTKKQEEEKVEEEKKKPTLEAQREYYRHAMNVLNGMFRQEGITSATKQDEYIRDILWGAVEAGELTEEFLMRIGYSRWPGATN